MPAEKHGRGVAQARQTLETFASVGVDRFDVTQTDWDGHKWSFHPAQSWEALWQRVPELLGCAVAYQRNVIVRPRGSPVELVQLDDVDEEVVGRVQECAFLILATSAQNHQAWVAVRECASDFARRLRRGTHADPGASGATRLPGSVNYKRQYAPDFPTVQVRQAMPRRIASQVELETLGLVVAPEAGPRMRGRASFGRRPKSWPSYERCLGNAPRANNSSQPDVSRADFTFCMIAIDWGWNLEDTCARLLEKSRKAHKNGEGYAALTVQRAAAAVQRRRSLIDLYGYGRNNE